MTKRRFRLLSLILAIVLLPTLSAMSAALPGGNIQPNPLTGPGDLYLALGDSLTAGIGASLPSERGYPVLLRALLERQIGRPVQLVNLGVPGETTASFQSGGQLDAAVQAITDARLAGLRISPITISLGANDLLQAAENADAREQALLAAETNLRTIYAQLRAATTDASGNPAADLITTTYYDPTAAPTPQPDSDAWWLARLNKIIVDETTRAGGRTANLYAAFRGHESDWTWYPIDIHPTNAGYEAIALSIWRSAGYDTTPPAVVIVRPESGWLTRPVPTVAVLATDQIGVTEVTLWVDGLKAGAIPFVPVLSQYATLWDTRSLSPGTHTLEVRAVDAAGNFGTATVIVEVAPATDLTPLGSPTVSATPAP